MNLMHTKLHRLASDQLKWFSYKISENMPKISE